ncbi:AAA family ATPase [Corynebacterium glutamicum]|uniref:AAA family ATPase n=1 Tax=Corynebacterium glutamicum TaxID=1718 RepID=UPI001B8C5548|nr:AAA family ATPase [Corynebacterium glutamicum]
MISEISLAGLPCFGVDTVLSDLTTINYIFGPNGSGKTTISQSLAVYDPASSSSVRWEQQPNTIKVYNRTYIRDSFTSADGEEPGVFLLGDSSREIFQRIGALENEQKKISGKIEGQQDTLNGFLQELRQKRSDLAETVWRRRADIPVILKDRMTGIKASKEQCLNKVLATARTHPERGQDTFAELGVKAKTAFDDTLTESALFPSPPEPGWDEQALQTALMTPILGSADIPLADLVNRLSISDWIREGLEHLHNEQNSEEVCPFCQQALPRSLAQDLASIFDETYQEKHDEVSQFQTRLADAEAELKAYEAANFNRLKSISASEEVTQAFHTLKIAVDDVQKSVQKKVNKPSEKVETSAIGSFYDLLKELVLSANKEIEATNSIIADRRKQRSKIIDASWQEFARGHLNDLIEGFEQDHERIQKSVNGIENSIKRQEERLAEVERELRELRKQATSSARAVQDINDLLSLSQFHSFKLDSALTKPDGYRIIRDNGQPADIETLSEGERTFITFLYFYHSLSAVRQDGEAENIVAVVDDPISSLDGDIMFVVSALMRRLIQKVRDGKSRRVSQVIMLTHNTRFHNEVCYQHQGELSPTIKFYRIRKFSPDPSRLEDCGQKNPIRTAYQELWDEVAVAESRPEGSMPWLPNVLRRILESYFTTLGGRGNLYELGEELTLNEKALHDALIAWSHSGSHTIMDAEIYTQPAATNGRWLEAFTRIFEKNTRGAHFGHYEMMIEEARKYLGSSAAEGPIISV